MSNAESQWRACLSMYEICFCPECLPAWERRQADARGVINAAEASAAWPEAMVLFDVMCPHIAGRDDVEFHGSKGSRTQRRSRLSVHPAGGGPALAIWVESARLWSRVRADLPTTPRQDDGDDHVWVYSSEFARVVGPARPRVPVMSQFQAVMSDYYAGR